MPAHRIAIAAALPLALAACNTSQPSEPSSAGEPSPPPKANADFQLANTPAATGDPLGGKWTLADATKDIHGSGALLASIDTNHGKITCKLYEEKAPLTVANFVGLATGARTWKNPSGQWVNKPAYNDTTFHRIIKGFMIQGGDAAGTGRGEPGYVINDEIWPGGTHAKPGLLCMANRGPNTNGAQFFITESDGPTVQNLDRLHSYTIFGECTPVDTIHEIAAVPTGPGDRPLAPVTIKTITVAREKS